MSSSSWQWRVWCGWWAFGLALALYVGQGAPFLIAYQAADLLPADVSNLMPAGAWAELHYLSPGWTAGCLAFGMVVLVLLLKGKPLRGARALAAWVVLCTAYLLPPVLALGIRADSVGEGVGLAMIRLMFAFTYTFSAWTAVILGALVIPVVNNLVLPLTRAGTTQATAARASPG